MATQKVKKIKSNYLAEPILLSELILINNAKLLVKDQSLLNEKHLDKISELRKDYILLDERTDSGENLLQKEKREIRDQIRDLSWVTYTERDRELFGRMISEITRRIATQPKFSGYTFKDEMQSLAIQHILLYTYKFDPYRQSKITNQYASAFAYISTIAHNAAIATINNFTKEQKKMKEDWLEKNKLIHRDPNQSTYGEDYSLPTRTIKLTTIEEGDLIHKIKGITIHEETKFIIPDSYKITARDYDYILKYEHNISVVREAKIGEESDEAN